MPFGSKWNRRSFLGGLGVVAGAVMAPLKLSAEKAAPTITGFGSSGNPYDELGVQTVINCEGTMTVLGGSILRPELEAVMAQAGRHFVRIADLEVAAGKRIAEMLKLPEGYSAIVTSGAAAAMQSGLAGILTGDNEQFIKGYDWDGKKLTKKFEIDFMKEKLGRPHIMQFGQDQFYKNQIYAAEAKASDLARR